MANHVDRTRVEVSDVDITPKQPECAEDAY